MISSLYIVLPYLGLILLSRLYLARNAPASPANCCGDGKAKAAAGVAPISDGPLTESKYPLLPEAGNCRAAGLALVPLFLGVNKAFADLRYAYGAYCRACTPEEGVKRSG